MTAIQDIESKRLHIQSNLDALKTQAERNKFGQFATPTSLALQIMKCANDLLPSRRKIQFLDPAFGTGSFFSALIDVFPISRIVKAEGYEIDPHYGNEALEFWSETSLKLHIADFTQTTPPISEIDKANLIICNPPYVRHHHLTSEEKKRLQRISEETTGIKFNGLSGLYCYFLSLSHLWMAQNALAGWLVPSEFMDVNYGDAIKKYLLDCVTLLRVHRFDPDDVQFDDALVSSAVVWFKNSSPTPSHTVQFSYGGTLAKPRISKHISVNQLRTTTKWTSFPLSRSYKEKNKHHSKLSDLFTIKRGLATGANDFFVLTPQRIAEYKIPNRFLNSILPSPRFLQTNEIQTDVDGNPQIDRQLFLLACDHSQEEVKSQYPSLWNYLQSGVEQGISERYLCKHRSPWYTQENRPPSPFLCTYMGRQSTENGPFRFILNHSKATAANVYLMLYPKPALANLLKNDPELIRKIWQILSTIPSDTLQGEGRIYGGGLYKMEPRELGNAPADGIFSLLPNLLNEHAEQMSFL